MLSQEFVAEMKAKLLAQKQKLEEDLKGAPAHTELGSDFDSQVQEVQDDEVNRDISSALTEDLKKINAALEKIEAGTYGTDDEGKEIAEERLRILPWADKAL